MENPRGEDVRSAPRGDRRPIVQPTGDGPDRLAPRGPALRCYHHHSRPLTVRSGVIIFPLYRRTTSLRALVNPTWSKR